jgi:hypothetical protein
VILRGIRRWFVASLTESHHTGVNGEKPRKYGGIRCNHLWPAVRVYEEVVGITLIGLL